MIDDEARYWRVCGFCAKEIFTNLRGVKEHEYSCDLRKQQAVEQEKDKRYFKSRDCPAPSCGRTVIRYGNKFECECGWILNVIEGGKLRTANG